MSEPIGPGDWVECVDDDPCEVYGPSGLIAGALYRVLGAKKCTDPNTGYVADALKVLVSPRWHGLKRFRPIYRPRADFIESLKAPREKIDA